MANINTQLATIRSGVYGKDVREAIASALEAILGDSVNVVVCTEAEYEALIPVPTTYYIVTP